MDKQIKVIAALAGIALIVTVVLYALFENYSVFQSADKNIKLGGSVAFFFVLFTTEYSFIRNLYSDNLAPIRKALCGKWICVAEVKERQTGQLSTYRGTAEIQQGDIGKITVLGEIEGRSGNWAADEVVLTSSKLVYFFEVPLLELNGVTNLRFTYDKKSPLNEMKGYWILAGREGRGAITFTRTS